ncbi:glycoside hydrolase family 25 protein [Streptantibioticus silvisoli]|uniref:Glycoside hydrolase family 25 protein n=1 Tax=Streptantibioticus silvisoli TaxID=2705255 RepID=A0ABT6VUE6_9ACTN|nr:glycoside hydrolase family 25 protein [Streptantibioticus silvisoli]MDI5962101.1 glycoside hydrolase family 25 protein [Streptantibioticus silvisoli]
MTVRGVDVSSYQAADFPTAGLGFVFVKVTEGLSYVNPKLPGQRTTARQAGLTTGYYHYPHIANSPVSEADHFLGQLDLAAGDLIALDWEWYGQKVTAAQARAYKKTWLAHVKSKAPRHRVGLYSDRNNWTTVDTDSDCGDFLWIADTTTAGHPRIRHPWTFHQYSAAGGVDRDVADFPDAAALRAWAAGTPTSTTPPEEDDMPQWNEGRVSAGPDATTVAVPHGNAWHAYPSRALHLVYDEIGDSEAVATVRVAVHNGTAWTPPTEVKVTAGGGAADVDLTSSDVKVSLQTASSGVSYAIETY